MAVLGLFEGHFITPFFQKIHIGSNCHAGSHVWQTFMPIRLSRPVGSHAHQLQASAGGSALTICGWPGS